MKVIQINTVIGTGSVGRIAVSLYEMCLQNGIEAQAVLGRGKAPAGLDSYKMSGKLDFTWHVLRNFILGESGFGSANTTKKMLEWLKGQNPDIIHLHNIHGFYLNIELLFQWIKKCGAAVVWTFHDCWPMTGHCAYFDYVSCNKWMDGCRDCIQHASAYPYAIFRDNSIMNYKRKKQNFTGVPNLTIITPSKWLEEKVKVSFLKEYPVQVIPNGIDLEVFCPERPVAEGEAGDGRITVLGVANVWEKRKGLCYLLELARRLPDKYRIVLAGIGTKQRREIEAQIRRGAIPAGKVCMIGRTDSQAELSKLYAKAAVYVNTTLEDNFPTTNLEALACGTPVVTFDTGGSPESLDESTGAVVPAGDIDRLQEEVIRLSEEKPAQKESRRGKCRERALLYGREKCFQEYIKLYRVKAAEAGK